MKLRFSYTLATLWRSGQYQKAIDYYLKKPLPTTPAMDEGKKWDEYCNDYVIKHRELPTEFGGDSLINPRVQEKIVMPFNEICDVVGVFDVVTDSILHENKTGNSKDASDYCQDFQVSMYLMLLGEKVDRAYINHYNQYSQTTDRALIWNCKEERERGKNFVETLSSEIYDFFMQQGILS